MKRGEIWWGLLGQPIGPRPFVLISRQQAIDSRKLVTVAQVTSTRRGLPFEVGLGPDDGLRKPCVINCDSLLTVPKQVLKWRINQLSPEKYLALNRALKFSLGLD